MSIAFVSNPKFVEHRTGPHHPERPDRIRAIHRAVRHAGIVKSPDPFPEFRLELGPIDGRGIQLIQHLATPADPKWLSTVHTKRHIEHIRRICALAARGENRI